MAKAKTLKPSTVVESARGRVARWAVADGNVVADRRDVYLYVGYGQLVDVEELVAALKAAHLYHLNAKEA